MSSFDEKSGVIICKTDWGNWCQTLEEIIIEVDVAPGTKGKDIKINIKPLQLSCTVNGKKVFEGKLYKAIATDESTWSLEDKKLIRILLCKGIRTAENCWPSLFVDGQYSADAWTKEEMQKKLTLERFHVEHPGFDFSNAEITGNYQDGGPKFNN